MSLFPKVHSTIHSIAKMVISGMYIGTLISEMGVMLCTILTLKLAASLLGVVGFGEYSVAKRALMLVTFPLLMGLGTSIPRYVALQKSDTAGEQSLGFFTAGLIISAPLLFCFSLFPILLPSYFSWLFFGHFGLEKFAIPILVAIMGLYFQTVVYGYFRGLLLMNYANCFRFTSIGLIPPIAIVLAGNDAAKSIELTGAGWLGIALVFSYDILRRSELGKLRFSDMPEKIKELLSYGAPRVPGEFALFGLFAMPTLVITHSQGVVEAGFYSFGVSLLQIIGAIFATIGVLLLPYVSRLMNGKQWERIKNVVSSVHRSALFLSLCFVIFLQVFIDPIIPILMGREFSPSVASTRWLIWGSVPYVSYIILRSPLDAIAKWPYNSINLTITMLVLLGCLVLGKSIMSAQSATSVSLLLLSMLSVTSWRRSLGKLQI